MSFVTVATALDPSSPWAIALPDGSSVVQNGKVGDALGRDNLDTPYSPDTSNQSDNIHPYASCGNIRAVAPFGSWSESRSNCSLLGGKGSQKTYQWHFEDLNTTGAICVAGLGYTEAKSPTWQSAGCGQSGSTTVNWGEVASYPSVRGMSDGAPLVGYWWS